MNKIEFSKWKAWTRRCSYPWRVSRVHNGEDGAELRFIRGGTAGKFIAFGADGQVWIGSYRDADLDDISTAEWRTECSFRCANRPDALNRAINGGGLTELLHLLPF